VPYRELIDIAQQVVDPARAVVQQTQTARGQGVINLLASDESRQQIEHDCQLGDRVIDPSATPCAGGRTSHHGREDLLDL
jgi:hypothetical protein